MRTLRRISIFLAVVLTIVALYGASSARPTRHVSRLQDRDPMKPLQHVVASKTAKFDQVDKNDSLYKKALDAHDLAPAMKLIGSEGSFHGTVDKLYEEPDGDIVVFDFDPNYRTALTAVLRNKDFPKFPDVRDLKGKEIFVSGKFVDYHGKAQIELTDPKQIKLVN